MGLKSGDNGVKKHLVNNFPGAFKQFDGFGSVRRFFEADRAGVVTTLDGNVAFNEVPQSQTSFYDYCEAIKRVVKSAMGSAAIVVVVFDEPATMSNAKREEQQKRDHQKQKKALLFSDDFTLHPKTDDYDRSAILATQNCRDIVHCRPARERFFDAVAKQVLEDLMPTVNEWNQQGSPTNLLFDGLDPRGAERPIGEARAPIIWGTDEELARFFAHAPIGEGDMKLSAIEDAVRANEMLPVAQRHPLVQEAWVHLAVTIDTDSIAISLLDKARRDVESRESGQFAGLLMMRDRGKRDAEGNYVTSYLCCDTSVLYNDLQKQMWSQFSGDTSARLQRTAMGLLVLGWISCGCDYSEVKGMRADLVLECLPSLIRELGQLDVVDSALNGNLEHIQSLEDVLYKLIKLCAYNYSERPRARKATVASLQSVGPVPLKRSVWCLSYWNRHEISDTHAWGFGPANPILFG
jgi:hypothetical protein